MSWQIYPAIVGYVATDGTTGAWKPTRTEAEEFAAQKHGEENLEWGAIMTALDRYTGRSYACRHYDHHACTVPTTCGCGCHQKEAA